LRLRDEVELDEQLPELAPILALSKKRLFELGLRKNPRLDQQLADALGHGPSMVRGSLTRPNVNFAAW
jgi:hypothetical protein